jgi:hypothetical protein
MAATTGQRERRGVSKIDPWDGGVTRGSAVALPQRKQMSALSAISVPQCRQIIERWPVLYYATPLLH